MNQNLHVPLSIITLVALFIVSALFFSQFSSVSQRLDALEKVAREGSAFTFGGLPADWTNPEAPAQSLPLEEKDVPNGAIKLQVTAQGFSPNTFTVKAGEKVTLAAKSADQWVHTFVFDDPKLTDVSLGLASGETRGITFFAPKKKGEYKFFCNVPGHRGRGEEGVMIVK
ncbi:MAG: cupredoxin domain-containing protein [Candidatus Spechtbacteria bacterium]|nr:cupredoxin domain-containing protein [Candidatus Spechtbacteria bacterium]